MEHGAETMVVNDGPGDDANVRFIFIGKWPEKYENMEADEIEADMDATSSEGR